VENVDGESVTNLLAETRLRSAFGIVNKSTPLSTVRSVIYGSSSLANSIARDFAATRAGEEKKNRGTVC